MDEQYNCILHLVQKKHCVLELLWHMPPIQNDIFISFSKWVSQAQVYNLQCHSLFYVTPSGSDWVFYVVLKHKTEMQ